MDATANDVPSDKFSVRQLSVVLTMQRKQAHVTVFMYMRLSCPAVAWTTIVLCQCILQPATALMTISDGACTQACMQLCTVLSSVDLPC